MPYGLQLRCYPRGIKFKMSSRERDPIAASLRATTACTILISSDRRLSMLQLLRSMLLTYLFAFITDAGYFG